MLFRTRLAACLLLLAVGTSTATGRDLHPAKVGYSERGKASFYANHHQRRKTASGERYSHAKLTAAHRSLPFGSQVKVTNLRNGKSTLVSINERGPFVKGRIIDLSQAAFKRLAPLSAGVISVRIERVAACTKACTGKQTR